jgi:hypothetical protein
MVGCRLTKEEPSLPTSTTLFIIYMNHHHPDIVYKLQTSTINNSFPEITQNDVAKITK